MSGPLAELIAFFLELIHDFNFWRKKKKRRKFEKENNLSKKVMINPLSAVYIVLAIISIPTIIHFISSNQKKTTLKKITKIKELLELEKNATNFYPNKLSAIIRNNPTLMNITKDSWDNDFYYQTTDSKSNYTLISKGKDCKLSTKDDVE